MEGSAVTLTRPQAATANAAAALVQAWAEWADAGCHVHPCKADGSKNPVSVAGGSRDVDEHGQYGWGYGRIRDGELPAFTLDQFAEMVKSGDADGFGVFCGPPSGELEMLEVEGRGIKLLARVKEHAAAMGGRAVELLDRIGRGCVQRSPSDGRHFLYRVAGKAKGSVKLARRPDPNAADGVLVLAETRGSGAWFIASPSGGRTHKSGKPYTMERGSPATIPTITVEERDTLYALFSMIDEMPPEPQSEHRPARARQEGDPLRVGDDFNARATWDEILVGWKKGKRVGDRQHWGRPNKDKGTSATTSDNVLCCFSTSTPLPHFDHESGKGAVDKFGAYVWLHHGGDFHTATKTLASKGYGPPPPSSTQAAVEHARQWQPFPVELLPAGVREYVVEAAEGMAADPCMVALPTLAGLAAAIGNTRQILTKPDWSEPAILWTAIVAESGSMKTPTMRKALQFIEQREADVEVANAQLGDEYAAELMVYETQLAEWKRQARKSADQAGGPPRQPKRFCRTAYMVSDTTVEAVAGILSDNPRGVLLERDELSGWFGGFDRYKSGGSSRVSAEVGHWLSMHSAGPLRMDRKSTGRVYVPRASLSIAGGIQPDTLTQAIGREHVANGLLARFLLAAPPRRMKQFDTRPPGFATVEAARNLYDTLYSIPMPESGPLTMPLSSDGETAFRAFYKRHAARQHEATGVIASMLAKIEAAAARLALIIHVCRQSGEEPTLPNAVDAASVEAGVGIAEWFAQEWLRVYDLTVGGATQGTDHRDLLAWIEDQGGEVTVRDIGQSLRRYRDAEELERAVTALVRSKAIESFHVQNDKGGPPAAWVRLRRMVNKPR
jgi:hypothetical protein